LSVKKDPKGLRDAFYGCKKVEKLTGNTNGRFTDASTQFFYILKAYCFDQRLTIHSSSHSIQCISHVPSTFMNNALGEEERINFANDSKFNYDPYVIINGNNPQTWSF